jgi:hypothetical protein
MQMHRRFTPLYIIIICSLDGTGVHLCTFKSPKGLAPCEPGALRLYNPEIAFGDFLDIKGNLSVAKQQLPKHVQRRPSLDGRFKYAMV